uniref:Uncharacterized protein n=1 Tax=Leersia perrieri TaxID=77586 RepID=A0A0D9XS52_9ORYZ
MGKEIKFPSSHHITGHALKLRRSSRSSSVRAQIFRQHSDNVLVGMKRTLTFYYGKGNTTECRKCGTKEFCLTSTSQLPSPVMRCATGYVFNPPFGCAKETIAKRNDDLSVVLHSALVLAPLVKTVVEPNKSWLICCIYKKRQHVLRVIVPPAIGNAREIIIPPANVHAREGEVHFIDFLRQAPRIHPSSRCSCIVGPCLAEGSDESTGASDENDNINSNSKESK